MMDTLFVGKDAVLEREDSTLVVKIAGQPKRRFPVHGLRHIVIAGEARLTTAVIGLAAQADIRLTVLDWYGNVAGAFEPLSSPASGSVHLAQGRHVLDHLLRLDLARRIVRGTMRNLRSNLAYRAYRGVAAVKPVIAAIQALEAKLDLAGAIDEIMGLEGNARAWYFEAWPLIDPRLTLGLRVRRPPNNPINCLISWFNGLCYAAMRHAIAQTHLDGAVSFLHSPAAARHSLALDLAEPFKPVLADTLIFEIVLRDQMDASWFHQDDNVCRLTETGRGRTLELWSAKVEAPGRHGISAKTAMRDEALGIERHVLGLSEYRAYAREV